ncbi:MAG: hypothetical protein EPO06_01025 [Burkholderiaceae bacterium]|nr:MAG: hypothetical protein EPO06_01025 [Burkholderiaceae bacterium]
MNKPIEIKWLAQPEAHDYAAAASYLSLIYPQQTAAQYATQLSSAPMTEFKAKDIFRASGLPLLGQDNFHVKKNLEKIQDHQQLSPILLVRDTSNGKVIIADGYHRMCSVYAFNEDAMIPCKIV